MATPEMNERNERGLPDSIPDVVQISSNDDSTVSGGSPKSPPQPPRSAFICFRDAKIKAFQAQNDKVNTIDVLQLAAEEWNRLSPRERGMWDEAARDDKLRYVQEKANYKGKWNLPVRRKKKHPSAPRRPMSAFLKFSQKRRKDVKAENPNMANTDISRLLGAMWRNATPEEKEPYVSIEKKERAQYNADIKKWREDQAKAHAMSRTNHYAVQQISDSSHYRHELNGDGFEPFSSSEQVFREYKAPIADANPWGNYSMDRSDAHEEFHSGKDDRIHRPVPHHARSDVQQRYVPYYGPPRHHHHHYSYQPPQYYRPRQTSQDSHEQQDRAFMTQGSRDSMGFPEMF